MRIKLLRLVLKVAGLMFVLALPPMASAVTINMTVPDCPSGTKLTFDDVNNTLGCVTTGNPSPTVPGSCAITGNSSTQLAPLPSGSQVTLIANCATPVGATITYQWNSGDIVNSRTVAPPEGATTYSVTPKNGTTAGAVFSTTVYIGTQVAPTTPPSGCTISQSPNTLASAVAPGTSVQLTVSCSGGTPTKCVWTNADISSGNQTCSATITAPSAQSTGYSVTPSNSGGSAFASTNVMTTYVPPNTGNVTNYCTANDQILDVSWPAAGGQVKQSISGFGNQRVAFRITVPASLGSNYNINSIGFMHIVELPGAAVVARDMTVSKNPCDFTSGKYLFSEIGYNDTAPGANFGVNNPRTSGDFNLAFGDTVYVNVRNTTASGAPSCPFSTCNIFLDFATPNR